MLHRRAEPLFGSPLHQRAIKTEEGTTAFAAKQVEGIGEVEPLAVMLQRLPHQVFLFQVKLGDVH